MYKDQLYHEESLKNNNKRRIVVPEQEHACRDQL